MGGLGCVEGDPRQASWHRGSASGPAGGAGAACTPGFQVPSVSIMSRGRTEPRSGNEFARALADLHAGRRSSQATTKGSCARMRAPPPSEV